MVAKEYIEKSLKESLSRNLDYLNFNITVEVDLDLYDIDTQTGEKTHQPSITVSLGPIGSFSTEVILVRDVSWAENLDAEAWDDAYEVLTRYYEQNKLDQEGDSKDGVLYRKLWDKSPSSNMQS